MMQVSTLRLFRPADTFLNVNAVNHIRIDDEQSSGLIKGVSFGSLEPGATIKKTLHLVSTGGAGDRSLDISLQSMIHEDISPDAVPAPPETPTLHDTSEMLETLVVPTVDPFKLEQTVTYRRTTRPTPGLLDLSTFEGDYWDDVDGGEAVINTSFSCAGPWGVKVEQCKLLRKVIGPLAAYATLADFSCYRTTISPRLLIALRIVTGKT
jgi:hypothetical protein